MGLLDKAGEIKGDSGTTKKAAKKESKPAPMKKAKPAKAAKPAKVKKKKSPVDRSLPEEFILAGRGNRAAAAFINFAWNWGAIVSGVALNIFTGAQITFILLPGLVMAALNIFFIPSKWGRNIGQFASRTKYIRFTGKKPFFLHGILSNTDTLFFLVGLWMAVALSGAGQAGTGDTDWVMVSSGLLFLCIPLVNYFFRKYTDAKQSLWDYGFGAYLVTHTPTGEETGWAARFERMGDFVEKRQAKASQKKAEKEESEEAEEEDKS